MELTREQVAAYMAGSTSASDWDNRCDTIKEAFDGGYPSFWYEVILASGVANRTLAKFGESDKLTIRLA